MATTSFDEVTLWAIILVIAIGTFTIRQSFLQLFGRLERVPPSVDRALKFVPAAVLTALFVPSVLSLDASLAPVVEPDQFVAAVVGGVVAWRTGSVLKTMVVGMSVLWLVSALV